MEASLVQVDALSKQLEQLLAKKAAITSPLDDEIEKLTQQIDELKPCTALPTTSSATDTISNDVLVSLVAACASDNTNAFARAGRLLFKANVKLSSVRSDRKLSLLHTSARFGSIKIVSQILESEPILLSALDDLGRDALMVSVLYRQLHAFHIIARMKDCSFAHQSLPFHNNCLHTIAQFGLISFARELLSAQRGSDSRVQLAMSQYNSDGLRPIHIMAARLDTEMIQQAASANPLWLDACTATGANIVDTAVTSQDGLLSPGACFAFICEVTKLHPPLLEQFLLAASNRYKHTGVIARCEGALLAQAVLSSKSRDNCLDYLSHSEHAAAKSFAEAAHNMFKCFLDADDHDAILHLLQAFFNHRPPIFDNNYILRFLSTTVCSRKDGVALKQIIAFSRANGLRHVMFSDEDMPPSLLASKCGNLSAVIALQEDGTFDCLSRDMLTGLNAAQFSIINGHDHILQHLMSLPDVPAIVANISSFGDSSLHLLAWSALPDAVAAQRALQFIGFGLKCGARNCDGLTAGDIASARHMPELCSVLNAHHMQQTQFFRSACLALCEAGDFEKFKSLYKEESVCFAPGTGSTAHLLAFSILCNSGDIFSFLLKRSVVGELADTIEPFQGTQLPLLLYTAIVLHRNSMFFDLLNLGLGLQTPAFFVNCSHIAFQSCNWQLLHALWRDSRCNLGPEGATCALLLRAANSLHAPSVLLLLQTVQLIHGAAYLKNCINTATPQGLTLLNVVMILLRSCERDSASSSQRSSCCIPRDEMIGQCIATMRCFIDFGANPNFSDSQGSSLAEFCRANLTKETSALVLNLFSEPDIVRSQMIECVMANDSGSLTAIIQQHSITEVVDEHGLNLAFLAGSLGHLSCFQVLFRLSAAPERLRNFGSLSLLHAAACKGKTTIVSFLVDSGFDLNIEADDGTGFTPLLCAVVWGHIEVVQLMIQRGADTDHRDARGLNCLGLALQNRAFGCAQWLLMQPFAKDLLIQPSKLNETVLHIAVDAFNNVDHSCDASCKNIIYTVIRGSSSVFDLRSADGVTAMEKAIQLRRSWLIGSVMDYASAALADSILQSAFHPESPLNFYANPNALDRSRNPVLHLAVCMQNASAVQFLVAAGADVNGRSTDGWTPLLAAAALGDCSVCELLLKHSADVHASLSSGYNCTPLQLAAAAGKSDVISRLLPFGALLDTRNDLGLNAVHLALLHGHREAAFAMISSAKAAGKSNSAIAEFLRTPQPPLLHRLLCSDVPESAMIKCVNLLLLLGVDADEKDSDQRSPLQVALAENLPLVAAALASHTKNASGDTRAALFAAADACNASALRKLLAQCADLNCKEFFDHGRPLLHAVVRACSSSSSSSSDAAEMIECVRAMLSNPQCDIEIADDQGCTPLHVAVSMGNGPLSALLLEAGANCDSTSLASSALHTALTLQRTDCAELLLKFGANLLHPLGPHGAYSCVVAAVCSGFSSIVHLVTNHLKIHHRHSLRSVFEFQSASDGATLPLLWMENSRECDEETLDVLQQLILGGADVMQCSHASIVPFQIANARSFPLTARFISGVAQCRLLSVISSPFPSAQIRLDISSSIAGGGRLDAADELGLLPIHVCAAIGSAAALECLLSSPTVQVNAADAQGHTARCHAASNGRAELLPILIRSNASQSSPCGCSSLSHAVISQQAECIHILGRACDITSPMFRNPILGTDVLQLAIALADVGTMRILVDIPAIASHLEGAIYDGGGSIVHYLASLQLHAQSDNPKCEMPDGTAVHTSTALAITLAQAGAVFLRRNSQGHTAIHLFRLYGDAATAEALEVLGSSTLAKLNKALVAAAAEGNCENICKLIDDGAEIDCIAAIGSGSSSSALHQASRNGHELAVRSLIERRAFVDVVAPGGRTPLHEAICAGYTSVVALLLQAGASTTIIGEGSRGQPGLTALEMALSYHQFPIAHLLISSEPEGSKRTPATHLSLAILEGDADAVDFLLDIPPSDARELVAASTSTSNSALLDAVLTSKCSEEIRLRIITTLRRSGLSTDGSCLSGVSQASDAVRTLISQPLSQFVLGKTRQLLDAVSSAKPNILAQWLGCGVVIPSCMASDGSTLLHVCVSKDAVGILATILADKSCNSAFVNTKASSGLTALHLASKLNRPSCISLLLQHSADVNMATDASCDSNTPLLLAAANCCNESFTVLLASGADAFAANRLGLNVLHVAAAAGNVFALKSAIASFASSDSLRSKLQSLVASTSQYGDSPLHLCVLTSGLLPFKALKCSLLLLQVGASAKVRNSDGKTPIDLAEECGRRELAHLLRRAAVGPLDSTYKITLLHMVKAAISASDVESLSEMLKEESDVVLNGCLPDMEGDTSLHLAASLPSLDIISLLLHHQHSNPNAAGCRSRRPLHFAAFAGHAANARLLLNARADVDAAAADGSTALVLACAQGHASVVEVLVGSGCNTGIFDSSGLAAIHHAARACSIDCISALAACANTLDSRRDPPLYHALTSSCDCDRIAEAVDLLLAQGASPVVPCPSAANSSPGAVAQVLGRVFSALCFWYKQIASVLIDASGCFGCKWGEVMLAAAEMNDTETLSKALALAGSANLRDEGSGCTALHHAVRCGSGDAISMLLAAGADCTVKDNSGCSSFILAAFRSDPSALKAILDSLETSTFCSLLQFQSIGLFESLESSCRVFAEKLLGVGAEVSGRLAPPALSLLVWRLPAAAISGLDTDSLSHFVAICCFVGCEHSAKAIIFRRPSVLSCLQCRGLSLLHIAVLTGARSVAQQALLSAAALADSPTSNHGPSSTVAGNTPLQLACIGCTADDERSIGELLLAGADTDNCTPAGYKARDLLLQTVPEQAEFRAPLLALLDRPAPKPARVAAETAATPPPGAVANAPSAAAENAVAQDVTSSFVDCIRQFDIQRFKVLLGSHGLHHSRPSDGATLLHLCCQCGFIQGVALLLQSKCPMRLDLHGCTALHHAAAANQPLIASELLSAFPSSLGMCNDSGDTAFIAAIRAQAPAVVAVLTAVPAGSSSRAAALAKALLAPGAEGLPPLHLAVKIGALRCAELILAAQPSHANLYSPTIPRPLHVVAASSSEFAEGAARLLLQAGADVAALDSKGLAAADVADGAGNAALARILRNVASAVADLASLKVAAL